ncbi:GNAT family N-acetyltransferase [Nesterenkonia rhizosphaerae]|uniref:BioF2-like acetyltransferase domain-containing protein n=1 Tax=Nesterenkonia rhizosphaerae TaxID=1348272 RepID=A0ABP9FUN9_9MICC
MNASVEIWDAEVEQERARWSQLWTDSPMKHPFAQPDLCKLLAPANGRLMAAVLNDGPGHVLYPFYLREIPETTAPSSDSGAVAGKDITSPYGYGGPLHWGLKNSNATAARFWTEFDAWAAAEGVVSEFVRFSLFPEELLPYPGPTRARQLNYVRDLDVPDEELWDGVESKVRRNARRARREGVRIIIDDQGTRVEDFLRIYLGTMDRRASAQWYRFDRTFFEGLHLALPGQFAYVLAELDGEIVSADLLLLGTTTGYYFLGGTEASSFSVRPNDLVKVEAMNWLRSTGRRRYVLGGGVHPQDGLERYKRGFAPHGAVSFSTGERVLAPQHYERLVERTRKSFSDCGTAWDESDDFFPPYRRQVPARLPALQTAGGATS